MTNRIEIGSPKAGRVISGEEGNILVLTALSLPFLLGFVGLAIDVGFMHFRQAQLQTAADAAAIAAGLEIGNCSNTGGVVCVSMNTAAAQALIETGITGASIQSSSNCTPSNSSALAMTINVGPCVLGSSDPNNGDAFMAEVVLTQPQNILLPVRRRARPIISTTAAAIACTRAPSFLTPTSP
jgi:uncharacterized membrane protein